MKQFQKIAIGLLGLTNPEMFIPRPKVAGPDTQGSPERRRSREGRGVRALRSFKFMLTALALGSRTVALADNSELRSELRQSASLLYGPEEG